ncbi:MAG: hypothetical protein EZS28_001847, partial [Streblomastix strix]
GDGKARAAKVLPRYDFNPFEWSAGSSIISPHVTFFAANSTSRKHVVQLMEAANIGNLSDILISNNQNPTPLNVVQNEDYQKLSQDLEKSRQDIAKYRSDIARLREEQVKLKAELASIKQKVHDKEEKEKVEKEQRQKREDDQRKQKEKGSKIDEDKERERIKLKTLLEEKDKENEKLLINLQVSEKRIVELENQIQDLQKELKDMKDQLQLKQLEITTLRSDQALKIIIQDRLIKEKELKAQTNLIAKERIKEKEDKELRIRREGLPPNPREAEKDKEKERKKEKDKEIEIEKNMGREKEVGREKEKRKEEKNINKLPEKQFRRVSPDPNIWSSDHLKASLAQLQQELISNIKKSNSIFPESDAKPLQNQTGQINSNDQEKEKEQSSPIEKMEVKFYQNDPPTLLQPHSTSKPPSLENRRSMSASRRGSRSSSRERDSVPLFYPYNQTQQQFSQQNSQLAKEKQIEKKVSLSYPFNATLLRFNPGMADVYRYDGKENICEEENSIFKSDDEFNTQQR